MSDYTIEPVAAIWIAVSIFLMGFGFGGLWVLAMTRRRPAKPHPFVVPQDGRG